VKVMILYANGSTSEHAFKSMHEARVFTRHGISYSGDRVRRVEVHGFGDVFAVWDSSWTDESKYAGLYGGAD
jgi:hypothetical protein